MLPRAEGLAVKRTSTGLGLFTVRPIQAGRRVVEYTGVLITNEEAAVKGGKYLFGIDEKYTLDGSPRSNTARYVNHSCRPNAEAFIIGRRVWIYSARETEAGEEITLDYGGAYFDEHIRPRGCRCGACARQGEVR
jgi:SET domain-containing protein